MLLSWAASETKFPHAMRTLTIFRHVDPHQMSEPQLYSCAICAGAEAVIIPAKDQQLVSDACCTAGNEHKSSDCFTIRKPTDPVVRSIHSGYDIGHVDRLMKDR